MVDHSSVWLNDRSYQLHSWLFCLPSPPKHEQIWWSGPSCGFALDPLWVSQWASHGAPRQWRSQHVTRHFPLTITPLQPNEAEQQSCNCHLLWSRMKLPKHRWKWQSITPESNRVYADEFKCRMRVIVRFICTVCVCVCDVNRDAHVKIEFTASIPSTWTHWGADTHTHTQLLSFC